MKKLGASFSFNSSLISIQACCMFWTGAPLHPICLLALTGSHVTSTKRSELIYCFPFSYANPVRKPTVGFRFCLCSPLQSPCRCVLEVLGWESNTHRRGTQPELSESRGAQENTGAPKQNTFYGNGYIYLHGSQKNHGRMAF